MRYSGAAFTSERKPLQPGPPPRRRRLLYALLMLLTLGSLLASLRGHPASLPLFLLALVATAAAFAADITDALGISL
jgi:hypothetical protein